MVDVNLLEKEGLKYIEVDVAVSPMAISYHGVYHYRTGSTKQELKGTTLNDFLLKKMGQTWDDMGVEYQKAQIYNLLEKVGITFEKKLGLISKV